MPLAPLVDPWQRQQIEVIEDLDVSLFKLYVCIIQAKELKQSAIAHKSNFIVRNTKSKT
jgi:hypothetical protein